MSNPFNETKDLLLGEKVVVSAPFMTNRILSFNPSTFILASDHNKVIGRIPKVWSDKIFQCVPKYNRPPILRYARKKKEQEPILVDKICQHFCVSKYHADQIIALLRLQGEKPEKSFGLKKGE